MTFNNNIGGLHTSPIKAALNVIPKKKKKIPLSLSQHCRPLKVLKTKLHSIYLL